MYSMGPGIRSGLVELISHPNQTLNNFYFDALKFTGFAIFLVGIFVAISKKEKVLIYSVLVGAIAFSFFMMQAGHGFQMHEYYTLPFIPFMSAMAGYGLVSLKMRSFRIAVLAIVLIEGVLNQQHDFFIKEKHKYKLGLEALADDYVPRGNLVIVNGGYNPQLMYFAHRRGWAVDSLNPLSVEFYKHGGAHFIIWDKHYNIDFPNFGEKLFEDQDFIISRI